LPSPASTADSAEVYQLSGDDQPVTEDFSGTNVSLADPVVALGRRAAAIPCGTGSANRNVRGTGFASVELLPASRPALRLPSLAANTGKASATRHNHGDSIALDTVALLQRAMHHPPRDRVGTLQEGAAIVEQIPTEHLEEITTKLRADYGVKNQAYEPRREAADARDVDVDHGVVYYRLVTRKGKKFFQELLVDTKGLYLVIHEKPEANMDISDQAKLQVFSSPALGSLRNIALGIIDQQPDPGRKKK
jgi:hypothetical protein